MSRLRDEEKVKKDIARDEDNILTIGEEGAKGRKAFKEYQDDEVKKDKKARDAVLNILDANRNKEYTKFLAEILYGRIIQNMDLGNIWKVITHPTEKGVIMELKSPDGRIFRTAFEATRDPLYDMAAIDNFTVRADATMSRIYEIKER